MRARANPIADITVHKAELIAEFEIGTATEFGFKVRKSADKETVVGYEIVMKKLFADWTNSGRTDFQSDFAAKHEVPFEPDDNQCSRKNRAWNKCITMLDSLT
ncbi:GH32 C-terminal domain-containing protein [Paenibacillus lautus]|uniref:GH32 C-terminal domain-containing protein n=1 Tax=Paenibacillus lautus TaxID=1401 RepID=UPI001C7D9457|nr:GH32 C-terminal domain-containing protein [Paenibacillus lautus]MBX4149122.1 GH32 C-terminal domain-containing protein [Paenibacillus lautus]